MGQNTTNILVTTMNMSEVIQFYLIFPNYTFDKYIYCKLYVCIYLFTLKFGGCQCAVTTTLVNIVYLLLGNTRTTSARSVG